MPVETDRSEPPGQQGRNALVAVLRLLGALPLGVLRALGALLGLAVYLLSPGYRRKLRANLRTAGYPSRADALRAAAEAGRMVGELPYVWRRTPAELAPHIECADLAVLDLSLIHI